LVRVDRNKTKPIGLCKEKLVVILFGKKNAGKIFWQQRSTAVGDGRRSTMVVINGGEEKLQQ